MSQLEVITATSPIDFEHQFTDRHLKDGDLVASPQSHLPLNGFTLSQSSYLTHDYFGRDDSHQLDDDLQLPNLPTLHRGHSAIHLRNGVINASRLAEDHEPDSEKAFFVADLSYVYKQHERWKKCLPEVQPFYGELSDLNILYVIDSFPVNSRQVQPRSLRSSSPGCAWNGLRLCFQRRDLSSALDRRCGPVQDYLCEPVQSCIFHS